jgi:hypothetical protein
VQRTNLRVDVDVGVVEIHIVPLQAGQFVPAHAGVGRGEHQHPIDPAVDAGGDLGDCRRTVKTDPLRYSEN